MSKKLLLLLLLPLLLTTGCSKGHSKAASQADKTRQVASVINVGPKRAAALLKKYPDMVLLDIRSLKELQGNGSIDRSILTPYWSLVRNTMKLPKDKPIMLVGTIGSRSYAAGQILARNGYQKVYNIRGGIIAWKDAGLPLKYWTPPSTAAAQH